VTHVRPLVELPGEGGATLVECQLETGRQHQIRIHLAEAGHPVVGEKVYVRGLGVPSLAAPRTMLHARALGFTHPARPEEEPVRFEAAWPEDFATVARRLGWQG
jgi:23S rRNA pseudouridine1911/1915/1917 synthase